MKVGDKCENECAGSFGSTHPLRWLLVLWTIYWYLGGSSWVRVLLRLIPARHHRFEGYHRPYRCHLH